VERGQYKFKCSWDAREDTKHIHGIEKAPFAEARLQAIPIEGV